MQGVTCGLHIYIYTIQCIKSVTQVCMILDIQCKGLHVVYIGLHGFKYIYI